MALDVLKQQISEAAKREEKLVIFVGRPGSGKSRILRQLSHFSYVDVSRELSEKLLPVPSEKRPEKLQGFLQEIIELREEPVLILDNIGILFFPEANIDPLKALAKLSKEKTLVAAWVGTYDGTTLTWSEPSRPDYRTFAMDQFSFPIIPIDN